MRLLVVEDNRDLIANLYDYFEPRGNEVDAADNARSGLELALSNEYDAVVLDLMLPGMDGIEVARRLREAGRGVPILMLTARDRLEDKLEGFASGADDYLVKPFAFRELNARLNALVRRRRGEHVQRRYQVADLVYDPVNRRVERAGRVIDLPPTPLRILDVLVRRSPRVVRRQELESALWGDSPPDSDALRAHMHVLRSAVDKPFRAPLISTVHGIGYRLAEPDGIQA